jgi:ribosomal protein L37AE/L43A
MNNTHKAAKFCPKCGSTNVFFASGLPQLWSIWDCKNCGYRGALILEDGKLAAKLRSEWKKKKLDRTKRLEKD